MPGFISKQTPLPVPQALQVAPQEHQRVETKIPEEVIAKLEVEPAELREPVLGSEAGSTATSAHAAGGYEDRALAAGFISKQTPRS